MSDGPEVPDGDLDAFEEQDLDELEELEELEDEDFDPAADEALAELEPGLDAELVDEELDPEDAAIVRSLTAVDGVRDADAEDEDDEDDEEVGDEEPEDVADEEPDDEDDEGAEETLVAVVDEDEGLDGLREGEFICSSCYLAKGPSQLADAKRQICVDCI